MIKLIPLAQIETYKSEETFIYSKRNNHQEHVTQCIIRKYGQFKPLLVEQSNDDQDHYYLIAGSSILRALEASDTLFAYCWVFKGLTVSECFTLNMIDNQSRQLEVLKTAKQLEIMLSAGEVNYKSLANVLHHTRDEIKNFKDLKDFNWDDFDNDPNHFQTQMF